MNLEQIIAAFPITFEVTQDIIDDSDIDNIHLCIGANSIRAILASLGESITSPEDIMWGDNYGSASIRGREVQLVSSENMMNIASPKEVKFSIPQYKSA